MTLLDVHIRNEWLRVTVTREPDESCASWAGTTEDGKLVAWDARDEVRQAVGDLGCRCGSGAHPRRCAVHPDRFDLHGLQINYELCDEDRAELGGRALGWQRRALEAEQSLARLLHVHECDSVRERYAREADRRAALYDEIAALESQLADAQRCIVLQEKTITRLDEQQQIAYAAGRRDALAVQQHRSELERDVIEAAKVHRIARMLRAPTKFERQCQLEKAIDVLIEAERAR